jgi:hypothetical protein
MASNSQEAPILWFLLIQIKPYRGIDAALNGLLWFVVSSHLGSLICLVRPKRRNLHDG